MIDAGEGYEYEEDDSISAEEGYEDDGIALEEAEDDYDMADSYAPVEYEPEVLPDAEYNTEEYSHSEENGFKNPYSDPVSTFSADVDTASFANIRRLINDGDNIPEDAVRIEEMINYFDYDYPEPEDGEVFSVYTELTECPWNKKAKLLHIGVQAEEPDELGAPPPRSPRRRPLRHIRPQRPIPSCDHTQQPPQTPHRNQGSRGDSPKRKAYASRSRGLVAR